MLKVTVINEIMKVGSTIPLRVTCSDFKQYILKGINKNVPTGKALFNEVVASRFAKLIGLDTPNTAIGILPESIITSSDIINLKKYGFKSGPCFLSEYLEGTSLHINPVTVKYISNIDIVPKLILFDVILMNTDREGNDGNWFHVKKGHKLIAIDHTNIFRIAQIWDKNTLEQDEVIPPKIVDEIKGPTYRLLVQEYEKKLKKNQHHLYQHQHLFSGIGRKIETITDDQIQNCFINIPQEWGISDEDSEAAAKFLKCQY